MKVDTNTNVIVALFIIGLIVLFFIRSRKSMAQGKKEPGAKCTKGIECSTNQCEYEKDLKASFCSEPSKAGANCNEDANCVSNGCRNGKCLTKKQVERKAEEKRQEEERRRREEERRRREEERRRREREEARKKAAAPPPPPPPSGGANAGKQVADFFSAF